MKTREDRISSGLVKSFAELRFIFTDSELVRMHSNIIHLMDVSEQPGRWVTMRQFILCVPRQDEVSSQISDDQEGKCKRGFFCSQAAAEPPRQKGPEKIRGPPSYSQTLNTETNTTLSSVLRLISAL